jgi:hypothetical protein
MKRPTKSFVVEIKRSARKASGLLATPAWDIAATFPSPTAELIAKSSQATASAVFQTRSDASPASHPAPAERRILPVLAVEADATPKTARSQDRLQPTGGLLEAIQPRRSPRRAKAPKRSDASAGSAIGVGTPAPPAAPDRDLDETSVPRVASDPARRSRGRLTERKDILPPGERWKRRLPKFMR